MARFLKVDDRITGRVRWHKRIVNYGVAFYHVTDKLLHSPLQT